ncbi:ribonuclease III [Caldicellulosiruptoraceae bacterium PP1]
MKDLEKKISYSFKNKDILKRALTHKSFTQDDIDCYERLEFLGDAVLELIISHHLFEKYQLSEGSLTKMRAIIVCKDSLYKVSRKLNFDKYLIYNKNDNSTDIASNKSILSDIFEAIVGAIYIDGGYDFAKKFVLDNLSQIIELAANGTMYYDYKTKLQEHVQKFKLGQVIYNTIKDKKDEKRFLSEVYIDNKLYGKGNGTKKKDAEQEAAKQALLKLEGGQNEA